ncbi:sulfotransferase domain-containing protein [Microbulbifer sp. ARAS458-1]|uniref:sulfotransferase domain-containing protein n=1 Tax=Microbulbifer sp. ARAS458-1 TaxID=3140242 RepID=UPI003877C144
MIKNALWISSYPKSGNTWIHSVIREAGRKYGFPGSDLDVYNLISKNLSPCECPAVSRSVIGSPCAVLKTHSPFYGGNLHKELDLDASAFVHIVRNPLDVLLSYINFSRIQYAKNIGKTGWARLFFIELLGFKDTVDFEKWKSVTLDDIPRDNLDHALRYFSESNGFLPTLKIGGAWFDHGKSWMKAGEVMPSVHLRYEDCVSDSCSFNSVLKLFEFEESDLHAAIDVVQKRTQQLKLNEGSDSKRNVFFNKMSAYYYLDYFSPAAVSEFISRHIDELSYLGYSDLPQK